MGKFIDLTGKVFGLWTVESRGTTNKNGNSRWTCLCQCGTIKSVISSSLMNGDSKSCGCLQKNTRNVNFVDITGQTFNRWTVMFAAENDNKSHSRWWCVCSCGTKRIVSGANLKNGVSKSCGCFQKEVMSKRMNGLVGEKSPSWRGGRVKGGHGYIKIYNPCHPNANKAGYVLEHVLKMSKKLSRPLYKNEVVHHKNGDRSDNRVGNLQICLRNKHIPGQSLKDKTEQAIEHLKKYGYEIRKKKCPLS